MVQHLVEGMTPALLTMQIIKLIHTQRLAILILFQKEHKKGQQFCLGLRNSPLMKWRCFILVDFPFIYVIKLL